MINIIEKRNCCGCGACIQKCPKKCITFKEDEEGFLYPQVDIDNCVNCGLCEKVCPVINQKEKRTPFETYAARNNNEKIRMESSSGGIFTLIAESIIKRGGVVFGAIFDEKWNVIHDYTENLEDLSKFRGSKYSQSVISDSFIKVADFLKRKRFVLFCGTPCQVAGLKLFLGKEYQNLVTIDFICHGVPSPGVWRKYLEETKNSIVNDHKLLNKKINIKNINFRDKQNGWNKYCFSLTSSCNSIDNKTHNIRICEFYGKNPFLKGFISNLYLRPSCYYCPSKCLKSDSDMTIADLWHASSVLNEYDDNKGTSLLIINNSSFNLFEYITKSSIWIRNIDYKKAFSYNSSIYNSSNLPAKRELFFENYKNNKNITKTINKLTKVNLLYRILRFINRKFKILLK